VKPILTVFENYTLWERLNRSCKSVNS